MDAAVLSTTTAALAEASLGALRDGASEDVEATVDAFMATLDELELTDAAGPAPLLYERVLARLDRQVKRRAACCALDHNATLWDEVFTAWGASAAKTKEELLTAALAKHNGAASPAQQLSRAEVEYHMHYHDPVQPTLSVQVKHAAPEAAAGLSKRDQQVLELIEQLKVVGATALAEVLRCDESSARRTLRRLMYRRLLYRVQLNRGFAARGSRSLYWSAPLGTAALEVIHEGRRGLAVKKLHRDSVGRLPLPHDLSANEVLGVLARDAAVRPGRALKGERPRQLELSVPLTNLLGPGQLEMSHRVPVFREGKVRRGGKSEDIKPDAFLTLGVREEGRCDVGLGLFIEFDSGQRDALADVGEQLYSYVGLAYAPDQPVKKRFPVFDVPGHQVSVLFVTQSRSVRGTRDEVELTERSVRLGTTRLDGLQREFFARQQTVSWEDADIQDRPLPPIYLCLHAALREQGWNVPVRCLHRQRADGEVETMPLWRAMLADAEPLLEKLRLAAGETIELDLQAARAHGDPRKKARSRAQQQQEQEHEAGLQAEFEARSARHRELEEQREALLRGEA